MKPGALFAGAPDEAARLALLRPAAELVADMPRIVMTAEAARRFAHGQAVSAGGRLDGEYAMFDGARLLGIATVAAGTAQPSRVLPSAVAGA